MLKQIATNYLTLDELKATPAGRRPTVDLRPKPHNPKNVVISTTDPAAEADVDALIQADAAKKEELDRTAPVDAPPRMP